MLKVGMAWRGGDQIMYVETTGLTSFVFVLPCLSGAVVRSY